MLTPRYSTDRCPVNVVDKSQALLHLTHRGAIRSRPSDRMVRPGGRYQADESRARHEADPTSSQTRPHPRGTTSMRVPRRHHEALEIAAPLLDPPLVFTEVVEHDLEHVHRCTGRRRRSTPACTCLGARADRVDHNRCPHCEATRDDGLSNEVANRTEWGLQLAAADDGGLHCVQAYDCCRHLGRQPTRQGRLPCSRQTCNDDEHAATMPRQGGRRWCRPSLTAPVDDPAPGQAGSAPAQLTQSRSRPRMMEQ